MTDRITEKGSIRRDMETAMRNSKAADVCGRYDIAGFYEAQAFKLMEKLRELEEEGSK